MIELALYLQRLLYDFSPWVWALAFACMTALDLIWAVYTSAVARKDARAAAGWALAIVALGSINTIAIVHDPLYLTATLPGAWLGTWLGVLRPWARGRVMSGTRPATLALELAIVDAKAEAVRAGGLWPPFNSAHEGFAVMAEEFDELRAHVWTNQRRRDLDGMRDEAIQVAAMALRFAAEVCDETKGRM